MRREGQREKEERKEFEEIGGGGREGQRGEGGKKEQSGEGGRKGGTERERE